MLSIRKYIAVAPGRKGIVMTDIELQILITLHLLTAEQKKVALLSALLSVLATEQGTSSADPESTPEHIS